MGFEACGTFWAAVVFLGLFATGPIAAATPPLPEPTPTHFYSWDPMAGTTEDLGVAVPWPACCLTVHGRVLLDGQHVAWITENGVAWRDRFGGDRWAAAASWNTTGSEDYVYLASLSNGTLFFVRGYHFPAQVFGLALRPDANPERLSTPELPDYVFFGDRYAVWADNGSGLGVGGNSSVSVWDFGERKPGPNLSAPSGFSLMGVIRNGLVWTQDRYPEPSVLEFQGWDGRIERLSSPYRRNLAAAGDEAGLFFASHQSLYCDLPTVYKVPLDGSAAIPYSPPKQPVVPIVASSGQVLLADYDYHGHPRDCDHQGGRIPFLGAAGLLAIGAAAGGIRFREIFRQGRTPIGSGLGRRDPPTR